jgi:hypothetical protein
MQKSGLRFLHQQSMELSWVRREGSLHGFVCRTPKYSRSSFLLPFFNTLSLWYSFYYMPICKGVERSRRLEVHLVKSRKLWWSNNGIP